MTRRPEKTDPLTEAVRRRRRRVEEARSEGEQMPWQSVGLIGSLAWQIIVPTLIGIALGRWIDTLTGRQVLFSAIGIVAGVSLGFWLAWRQANRK